MANYREIWHINHNSYQIYVNLTGWSVFLNLRLEWTLLNNNYCPTVESSPIWMTFSGLSHFPGPVTHHHHLENAVSDLCGHPELKGKEERHCVVEPISLKWNKELTSLNPKNSKIFLASEKLWKSTFFLVMSKGRPILDWELVLRKYLRSQWNTL